jgi:antitoxin component YwqK of YwqJK toxin-antitoxin module
MYKYLILSFLFFSTVKAQHIDYLDPQYDSIKTYDVFLEANNKGYYTEYKLNGKIVSREEYNNFYIYWNAAGACKPCYLYTYDVNDKLKHVAFQYKDCLVGIYREFYNDGTIKIIGQFKENTTGDWEDLFDRQLCTVRIGRWQFFSPEGKLYLIEFYDEKGKLYEKQDIPIEEEKMNLKEIIKSKF